MIHLERHIEILLLDNDCVIVPDLGGFMAHYLEARFDDSDNLFLPPVRTIGFNPKLTMNDSLLAQSYIEAYDISYPEAVRRIENEVGEIHQQLRNEGAFELYDIGVLRLNGEGNYEFEPCEAGLLTPQLYGLSGVEIERIAQPEAAVRPMHASGSENVEENRKARRIDMTAVRDAVAVAAVVAALFLITIPLGRSTRSFIETCQMDNSLFMRMMPKEITTNKPQTINQQAAPHPVAPKKAQPKAEKPVVVTVEAPAAAPQQSAEVEPVAASTVENARENYWCIVLASRVTVKNATAFAESLQRQGYSQAAVVSRPGGTKVVYGHFGSEEEAQKQLRSLREESTHFAEAWVYEMKN